MAALKSDKTDIGTRLNKYSDLDPFIAKALDALRGTDVNMCVLTYEGDTRRECQISATSYGETLRVIPHPGYSRIWHVYPSNKNTILWVYDEGQGKGRKPTEFDSPMDIGEILKPDIKTAIMQLHVTLPCEDVRTNTKPLGKSVMKNGMIVTQHDAEKYDVFMNDNSMHRLVYIYDEKTDNITAVEMADVGTLDADFVYPGGGMVLALAEDANMPSAFRTFERTPKGLKAYIEEFVIPDHKRTNHLRYYVGGGVTILGERAIIGDPKSPVTRWRIKGTRSTDLGVFLNSGRNVLDLKQGSIPWGRLNLTVFMENTEHFGFGVWN